MGNKKELKKLAEWMEAIEAEIKAFKETAEKNVETISAEIEKLVAMSKPVTATPARRTRKTTAQSSVKKKASVEKKIASEAKSEEPAKPARQQRARKPAAAKETTSTEKAQSVAKEKAETPKKETAKTKPARTRKKSASASDSAGQEKATRAPRKWAGATFVLYNCDEAKTPESLYNRNDEVFKDTGTGRRALWSKLKTEITEKRIEILGNVPMDNLRLEILDGKPESVSKHLKYGLIEKVEPKAE